MGLPLLDIIDVVSHVVDRVIPDPAAKMDLQLKLAQLADQENARQHDEMMSQMQTNTEEAKNPNLFVAGWRPFIGWTGGVGIAYSFVLEPVMDWTAKVLFHYAGTFPVLDTGQLMALVTGMLGFGGMRMVEKINQVPDSKPLGTGVPQAAPGKKRKKFLGLF